MKETKEQLALWYYKKYVEGVPLTQDEVLEAYIIGTETAAKKLKKQVIDLKNAYNSQLKDLKSAKLSKRIDQEKIKELEIRIDTLNQIL
jgi:hypothetical protein